MLAKTRKVAADLRPRAFEQNRCFGGPTGGSRAPTATAGALRCSTYTDEGGRDRTTGGRAGTGSGRAVPGPARAPATERRLRVRGHISTDDRFHAAGKSRRGSNIVRPRVHIVCGGVERRMTRASWRKARRSCNRMRFEWNIMVGPRPPDPASSGGARCILDRHGRPAPPGARRRDRGTPPQPRFGPESPRRRSDAEAARSVGETRPPGPPSGSFRPGLLRAGGPAPAARRPATRRR